MVTNERETLTRQFFRTKDGEEEKRTGHDDTDGSEEFNVVTETRHLPLVTPAAQEGSEFIYHPDAQAPHFLVALFGFFSFLAGGLRFEDGAEKDVDSRIETANQRRRAQRAKTRLCSPPATPPPFFFEDEHRTPERPTAPTARPAAIMNERPSLDFFPNAEFQLALANRSMGTGHEYIQGAPLDLEDHPEVVKQRMRTARAKLARIVEEVNNCARAKGDVSHVLLDVGEHRFRNYYDPAWLKACARPPVLANHRTLSLTISPGSGLPVRGDSDYAVHAQFGGKVYKTKSCRKGHWRETLSISIESVYDGPSLLPAKSIRLSTVEIFLYENNALEGHRLLVGEFTK